MRSFDYKLVVVGLFVVKRLLYQIRVLMQVLEFLEVRELAHNTVDYCGKRLIFGRVGGVRLVSTVNVLQGFEKKIPDFYIFNAVGNFP